MNNIEFRKIENISEFVKGGLESGKLVAGTYNKYGEITARPALADEKVITVMSDGLKETENTAVADENGHYGWVVTNPGGEKYIVSDAVFTRKYERIEGTEDRFRPVWCPITAGKVDENICFLAPWGEMTNLVAGGYIVFDKELKDIYGVQKKEFENTYAKV